MKRHLTSALAAIVLGFAPGAASATDATLEAMQDYLMFSDYAAGVIFPEQMNSMVFEEALLIDTRRAEEFEAGTIPGAINIEWREVLDRIDDIPEDRMTILFCNTGTLSAQATFALRVAGRDNVVSLQTGFDGWQRKAAFIPES